MASSVDTRFHDLAAELLGGLEGVTPEDISSLACDFQDAFEEATETVEERAQ